MFKNKIKLKLLYITNGINGSGGLERVISIKASYLAEHYNYDVTVLSLNSNDSSTFYEFSKKIKFVNINVFGNVIQYIIAYIKGIREQVNTIQPDIICVCDDGLKAFFIPQFLKTNASIIYERHASIQLNFSNRKVSYREQLMHYLMQILGRKFEAFIVLTNGNLKEWKGNNLKVIPNPLSFYPNFSSALQNKKVIVVGSHSYNKGYDLLLKVWNQVIITHPNWTLHFYGKYDDGKTYFELAKTLYIKESVIFSPPVVNIEKEYLDSSILALPSRSEGFGMVLIEAMACGLPTISFDCPHGPADIITHGEDGMLVPNGDVNEFAKTLIDLIEKKELRENMGLKAKENVKRYLPEHIMPLWDHLFQQLANARSL